jgi:hypothetical protein
MKEKILRGDFGLSELASISYRWFSDSEAWIHNPYQLYVPTVPEGYFRKDPIYYRGFEYISNYSANSKYKRTEYCNFSVILQKDYDDLVDEYLKDFAYVKKSSATVLQEETDPQTGTQRLLVTSDDQRYLYVHEVYKSPGKTQHVWYCYKGESDQAVPKSIRICGEENGGYYDVILNNFVGRVDVEWISQFGLAPFEGNEVPPEPIS